MANGYKVRLASAATDGTNIFLEIEITSPTQTYPLVRPVFKVGTAASVITAYLQNIATTGPSLTADISALVGQSVAG
jgi:hypothetical protein